MLNKKIKKNRNEYSFNSKAGEVRGYQKRKQSKTNDAVMAAE
jgi:hypothetical protein